MSQIIEDLKELKKINEYYGHKIIVGEGWIGKLIYYGLLQMENPLDTIELITYGELIEKKEAIEGCCYIVAKHEIEAKDSADMIEKNGYENVYYVSENVKNEVDTYLMRENPDIYECHVLIARKSELDKTMGESVHLEIGKLLSDNSFPIFQTIEIETINRCNGTCNFCPVNRNDDTRVYRKMEDGLFKKIIDELSSISYGGRLNLHSNNEPLIDDRIVRFSEYAAKKLPYAEKIIFTNGTLLNVDLFQKIINNIDVMCIDIYYDSNPIMEISKDLIQVLKLGLENDDIQKKVMVQFICRSAIRNNRGGQSKNRHVTYRVKAACLLPFIQMIVRPDGKVSLCCNDPLGRNTLGDVSSNTLLEVWNGVKCSEVRELIGESRQKFEFCKNCDNYATLNIQGNNFFAEKQYKEAWKRVDEYFSAYKKYEGRNVYE